MIAVSVFEDALADVRARDEAWFEDQVARFDRIARSVGIDARAATETVSGWLRSGLSIHFALIELAQRRVVEELPTDEIGSEAASSFRYAQAIAVLPTDPEHEARIDRLIDARIQGVTNKRPLRRRP